MEKKTIGQFIAALRKASGMTQKDLAEQLNVSDKAVSRWERDECAPDLMLIPVIADIFGVTSDELLRGERRSAAAAQQEYAGETAQAQGFSAKSKKQIKYLMKKSLTNFRIELLIASAVALVGAVIGLMINAFGYGLLGLGVAVIIDIAAVACVTVFTLLICSRVDWEEFEGDTANQYKKDIVYSVYVTGCVILAIFCYATLPLADADSFHGTVSWAMMRWSYGANTLLWGGIAAVAWLVMRRVLARMGLIKIKSRLKFRENAPILVRTGGILAAVMALTVAMCGGFVWYAEEHMLFAAGKEFRNYDDFKAYMEISSRDVHYYGYSDTVFDGPGNVEYRHSNVAVSGSDLDDWPYDDYYNEATKKYYYPEVIIRSNAGEELCRFLMRNLNAERVAFSDTDDFLPITVYTVAECARQNSAVEMVSAGVVLILVIEGIAAIVIYCKKRVK